MCTSNSNWLDINGKRFEMTQARFTLISASSIFCPGVLLFELLSGGLLSLSFNSFHMSANSPESLLDFSA